MERKASDTMGQNYGPVDIKDTNSLVSFKSALTQWLQNYENVSNLEFL